MFKYGEENSTPVSVWLPWHMPSLHVAWGSSHRWAGIFFCVQVIKSLSDSEDSDSPAVYGDLFPLAGSLVG